MTMRRRLVSNLGQLRGAWIARRRQVAGTLAVHPQAVITLSRSASLDVHGSLSFGLPKAWSAIERGSHPGQLTLCPGTRLSVRGSVHFGPGCTVVLRPGAKLTLEGPVSFSGDTMIIVSQEVTVGPGTAVAHGVRILDSDLHSLRDARGARVNPPAPVHIGPKCWIGQGVILLKGVSLGENSIVGAGSVVTRSSEPNSILVGNPARILRGLEGEWSFLPDGVAHATYFDTEGKQR